MHRFPDTGEFGQKIQEAELDYLVHSQRGLDLAGRELRRVAAGRVLTLRVRPETAQQFLLYPELTRPPAHLPN